MAQKRTPVKTIHKRELVDMMKDIMLTAEQMYHMGVRHGLERAYNLGGIDKAHKQQRDAMLEEKAMRRSKKRAAR